MTPHSVIGVIMGKLQEIAKIRFTEAYLDIVDKCKLVKHPAQKGELKKGEYEKGYTVHCEAIDIDTAFGELIAANNVFNFAKDMGL